MVGNLIPEGKDRCVVSRERGELSYLTIPQNGNPMGGLVFSTAFSTDGSEQQVKLECVRSSIGFSMLSTNLLPGLLVVTSPVSRFATGLVRTQLVTAATLDRIGMAYNMPNGNAKDGTFEVCDSDLMELPGVYTSNGQTLTYYSTPRVPRPDHHNTLHAYHPCPALTAKPIRVPIYSKFTTSGFPTTTSASSLPQGQGPRRLVLLALVQAAVLPRRLRLDPMALV
jgi:hypothetical protein